VSPFAGVKLPVMLVTGHWATNKPVSLSSKTKSSSSFRILGMNIKEMPFLSNNHPKMLTKIGVGLFQGMPVFGLAMLLLP
jgi:hypothetical protein